MPTLAATRSLDIRCPKVLLPLLQPATYKGAHGGRGGMKSWFFAGYMIAKAVSTPGFRGVCLRETQKSLDQSVKRLIEQRIGELGVNDQFRCLNTHIETPGGGLITFHGLQNHTSDSIKSLEGIDVAWVEEAQSVSQHSLTILLPTIRKDGSEVWFSWNPRRDTDPVDVFLRQKTPPDSIVVETNYTDNPWLSDKLKRDIEDDKAHDYDKYRHVWLGEYETHSESRVFRNWHVATPAEANLIDSPPEGTVFYYGCDWGFAKDPTVMVRCWLNQAERQLYVSHEVYQVGCEIEDTPKLFDMVGCVVCRPDMNFHCGGIGDGHGSARRWPIIADSARPDTISHMRNHGYRRMLPSKKGKDSVADGVEFLKSYTIVVHPRCVETAKELGKYSYKKDKLTEQVVPVLEDADNHCIDSLRYALETVRRSLDATATIKAPDARWQEAYY